MIKRLAVVVGFMAAVNMAAAQEVSLIKIADADAGKKTITTTKVVTKLVPEVRTVTVLVDGEPRTKNETVNVTVAMTQNVTIALNGAKGHEGDGQKLTDEQLWNRLKPGEAIVLFQGPLPEPAFLKLFRKEALIVVFPAIAPVGAGPPPKPEK